MPQYNYYNQELTANNFLEMASTATGEDQPSKHVGQCRDNVKDTWLRLWFTLLLLYSGDPGTVVKAACLESRRSRV